MNVSVIIPTYNRAGLIERAIHSVLSQTYTDLEVLIIDDASTDDTCDRVEALRQIDHRVRYFRHDSNRGAQAARNTGIQKSIGKYIAFLDSDNEWLSKKIEYQMTLFTQHADSLGAVYCGYWELSVNGDVLNEYIPRYRGRVYQQTLAEWLTDTSTLVVRRDVLEKIHGFDEDIHSYQEWDLCIRMSRECEFDFVPECLTLYHQHNSPSISKDYLKNAFGYLSIVDVHRGEILRHCGRRALSKHYLKTGRLFVLADRFDLAGVYFLKSVRCDPFKIKAWMHFGASLFGKDVYKFLRSMRHG